MLLSKEGIAAKCRVLLQEEALLYDIITGFDISEAKKLKKLKKRQIMM